VNGWQIAAWPVGCILSIWCCCPDLINGCAGAAARAALAHMDEIGCVLEADIYRPDFDFRASSGSKHRPDEELLLRALVQTFLDHSLLHRRGHAARPAPVSPLVIPAGKKEHPA